MNYDRGCLVEMVQSASFLCNAKILTRTGKFLNSNNNNNKALTRKCRRKPGIIKDFKKEERAILKSIAM